MKKKLVVTFSTMVLAGSLFATTGFAKNTNAKESLVALGDSITYGFNLGVNNQHPYKEAFPYLIENDTKDYRVNNLGVPGWTSIQLLDALKNDQKFRQAVQHADAITLNIGSNDLLQALIQEQNPVAITKASELMMNNIVANIAEIRSLTNAPIVVYNIYNPFQLEDPSHTLGDTLLPTINPKFNAILRGFQNVVIADAFTAFSNNQALYVRQNDVHPTLEGQKVLADLAEEALGTVLLRP